MERDLSANPDSPNAKRVRHLERLADEIKTLAGLRRLALRVSLDRTADPYPWLVVATERYALRVNAGAESYVSVAARPVAFGALTAAPDVAERLIDIVTAPSGSGPR